MVATYVVGADRADKAFSLVVSGLTVAMIFRSPLATFLGQHLGWRDTCIAVAALGVLAFAALWAWTPRTQALGEARVRSAGATQGVDHDGGQRR